MSGVAFKTYGHLVMKEGKDTTEKMPTMQVCRLCRCANYAGVLTMQVHRKRRRGRHKKRWLDNIRDRTRRNTIFTEDMHKM